MLYKDDNSIRTLLTRTSAHGLLEGKETTASQEQEEKEEKRILEIVKQLQQGKVTQFNF